MKILCMCTLKKTYSPFELKRQSPENELDCEWYD
jgi:hypothetical protein